MDIRFRLRTTLASCHVAAAVFAVACGDDVSTSTGTDGSAGSGASQASNGSGDDDGSSTDGAGGSGEGAGAAEGVSVTDGEFEEGDRPPTSEGYDGEQISELTSSGSLTNGGSVKLYVTVPGSGDSMVFVVAVEGEGSFTVTATKNADGKFVIELTLDVGARGDDDAITISVAPMDDDGDVGEYKDIDIPVVESGSGDLKVTLSFEQDTDLDLHVTEPDGTKIFWNDRESESGGSLDLDSNRGCMIDGVNVESVFWPEGSAPSGEYIVEIQHYVACMQAPVDYVVTVTIAGQRETFEGTFEPTETGEAGWREVTRFTAE